MRNARPSKSRSALRWPLGDSEGMTSGLAPEYDGFEYAVLPVIRTVPLSHVAISLGGLRQALAMTSTPSGVELIRLR